MNTNNKRINQLLADYCSGQLSREKVHELKQWIDASEENRNKASRYVALYKEGRELFYVDQYDANALWKRIEQQLHSNKRRVLQMWGSVAAVLVIGLSVSISIWMFNQTLTQPLALQDIAQPGSPKAILTLSDGEKIDLQQASQFSITKEKGHVIIKDSTDKISYTKKDSHEEVLKYNTINIPRGGEYTMELNDGTEVWFNSETEMRFPVNFIGITREVELLNGEAYFKVAHNAQKPFIVHTYKGDIEVLGTSFNVSAYRDDAFMATTLVEGRVKVRSQKKSVIIEPGTQAVVTMDDGSIVTKEVDAALYTSWVNGVFEYENATLEYICQKLGRWYDVDFEFIDEQIKNLHFTGAAKRYNSIEQICTMIEKTTNVKFNTEDDKIRVMRK